MRKVLILLVLLLTIGIGLTSAEKPVETVYEHSYNNDANTSDIDPDNYVFTVNRGWYVHTSLEGCVKKAENGDQYYISESGTVQTINGITYTNYSGNEGTYTLDHTRINDMIKTDSWNIRDSYTVQKIDDGNYHREFRTGTVRTYHYWQRFNSELFTTDVSETYSTTEEWYD